MLVDSSVARGFAVTGWARQLIQLCGGSILVADGVHSQQPRWVSMDGHGRASLAGVLA